MMRIGNWCAMITFTAISIMISLPVYNCSVNPPIATSVAEIKVTLPAKRLTLRSNCPDLAVQKLYGLPLVYIALCAA